MDEWFKRGIEIMSVTIAILMLSLLSGWGFMPTALLLIIGFTAIFVAEWMFTDKSEEVMEKDLKNLSNEIE
jgi:hypothetical protein